MTKLMSWLSEMLPAPKPPVPGKMIAFQQSPIRQHADAFASRMPDIPKTTEEMQAVLWVFGEHIAGDMERRMNHAMTLAQDAMNLQSRPIYMRKPERMSDMDQYEEENGKIGCQHD